MTLTLTTRSYRVSFAPVPQQPNELNKGSDRQKSILTDSPAFFIVRDNPNADAKAPLIEIPSQSQVSKYDDAIVRECLKQKVDPDLARAIMHMETTHGWYDTFAFGANRSVLPMNVHATYWSGLGYSKEDLKNAATNRRWPPNWRV